VAIVLNGHVTTVGSMLMRMVGMLVCHGQSPFGLPGPIPPSNSAAWAKAL
jgi:hypothetical protein